MNADTTVRLIQGAWAGQPGGSRRPSIMDTLYLGRADRRGQTLFEALVDHGGLDLPWPERAARRDLAELYEFKLDFTHDIHPGDRTACCTSGRRGRTGRRGGGASWWRRSVSRAVVSGDLLRPGRQVGQLLRPGRAVVADGVQPLSGPLRADHVVILVAALPSDSGRLPRTSGHRFRRADRARRSGRRRDGTVSFAVDGGYGNIVEIRHLGGYSTRYAHLSRFRAGDPAWRGRGAGPDIGYVGATGLATGPHLHYELRNGRPLNPRSVQLPGAIQLTGEHLEAFSRTRWSGSRCWSGSPGGARSLQGRRRRTARSYGAATESGGADNALTGRIPPRPEAYKTKPAGRSPAGFVPNPGVARDGSLGWSLFALAAVAGLAVAGYIYLLRETPGRGRPLLAPAGFAAIALLILLLFDPEIPRRGHRGRRQPDARAGGRVAEHAVAGRIRRARRPVGSGQRRRRGGSRRAGTWWSSARGRACSAPTRWRRFARMRRRAELMPALQAASESGARHVVILSRWRARGCGRGRTRMLPAARDGRGGAQRGGCRAGEPRAGRGLAAAAGRRRASRSKRASA